MPHSDELIARVLFHLKKDYAEAAHSFVIEKSLKGTRMFPDIQVMNGDQCLCVVEIGYTRPEKISAYLEAGIKDVRWYDKKGKLHATEHLTHVKKLYSAEPVGQYTVWRMDECGFCDCQVECYSNETHETGLPTLEIRQYCEVLVITDYQTFFAVQFCDACGETRIVEPNESDPTVIAISAELLFNNPGQLGTQYHRIMRGYWSQIRAWLATDDAPFYARYLDIPAECMIFLDSRTEAPFQTRITSTRNHVAKNAG